MRTMTHTCIDVRGALKNWNPKEWRKCVTDPQGRIVTPDEFRAYLQQCKANGWKVIPFGKACEGFDYFGGGCPGHPVPDPPGLPPWASDCLRTAQPEGADHE